MRATGRAGAPALQDRLLSLDVMRGGIMVLLMLESTALYTRLLELEGTPAAASPFEIVGHRWFTGGMPPTNSSIAHAAFSSPHRLGRFDAIGFSLPQPAAGLKPKSPVASLVPSRRHPRPRRRLMLPACVPDDRYLASRRPLSDT